MSFIYILVKFIVVVCFIVMLRIVLGIGDIVNKIREFYGVYVLGRF